MAIVSLDQAKAHVRVEPDYPDDQIQPHIDGAVAAAIGYLNCSVYATAFDRAAARERYPSDVAQATARRQGMLAAASAVTERAEADALSRLAEVEYREAIAAAERCIHGEVVNPAITSAVLMIVGHLYANRSTTVVGASVVEIPLGARALLQPYRRVMSP